MEVVVRINLWYLNSTNNTAAVIHLRLEIRPFHGNVAIIAVRYGCRQK
jgi:hypothetical protein